VGGAGSVVGQWRVVLVVVGAVLVAAEWARGG